MHIYLKIIIVIGFMMQIQILLFPDMKYIELYSTPAAHWRQLRQVALPSPGHMVILRSQLSISAMFLDVI